MQQTDEQSVSAENTGPELSAVARIANEPIARAEAARELFFLYFNRIERTIQRRLSLRGLPYDPASEHYGRVFDFVYRRVFAPEAIVKAVTGFDPAAGPLAGWLLRRVDFALRDWLKTVRLDRAAVNSVDPVQLDGPFGASQVTGTDGTPNPAAAIETALEQLSPAQRACSVLRILTVRSLTPADVLLLEHVSGRTRNEMEPLLREAAASVAADPAGEREQELLSEISDWMAWQRCQQQVYGRLRKVLIDETCTNECGLTELEHQARDRTADEIRREIRALRDRPASERRRGMLYVQFQLCCHELGRCERRLAELRREYAAARPVVLLSYEQIASVLGKSVASVTTHLHESRIRLERNLNQVKMDP